MRRGKVVGHLITPETNEQAIATMMVGRAVLLRVDKKPAKPGPVTFKVENLTATSDRGVPALRGISFELRQGEILGIAGVEGNGQSELVEVLAGTRRATGGRVLLGEQDVTAADARGEREAGVGHIPEDRRGVGLVLHFSVAENLFFGRERSPAFAWHEVVLRLRAILQWANRLVKEFDIRTPSTETPASALSGGNQQKIIVAREMGSRPKVLLAAQPTRGVDVGRAGRGHSGAAGVGRVGRGHLAVRSDRGHVRRPHSQHRAAGHVRRSIGPPHDRRRVGVEVRASRAGRRAP